MTRPLTCAQEACERCEMAGRLSQQARHDWHTARHHAIWHRTALVVLPVLSGVVIALVITGLAWLVTR